MGGETGGRAPLLGILKEDIYGRLRERAFLTIRTPLGNLEWDSFTVVISDGEVLFVHITSLSMGASQTWRAVSFLWT